MESGSTRSSNSISQMRKSIRARKAELEAKLAMLPILEEIENSRWALEKSRMEQELKIKHEQRIIELDNEIEALGDSNSYRSKINSSDRRLNDFTEVSRIELVQKEETLIEEESIFNEEFQENLEEVSSQGCELLEDLSATGHGEPVGISIDTTPSSSNAVKFGLNYGLDGLFLDAVFDADEDSCLSILFKNDQVFDFPGVEQFVDDKLGINVCDLESCLPDNGLIGISNKEVVDVRNFDSGSDIGSLNLKLVITGRLVKLYSGFDTLKNIMLMWQCFLKTLLYEVKLEWNRLGIG